MTEKELKDLSGRAYAGDAEAQNALGCYYRDKPVEGIMTEHDRARSWFLKAAEQGYAEAQYNYGVAYHDGIAYPNRKDIAREWLERAGAQGHEGAIKLLKDINAKQAEEDKEKEALAKKVQAGDMAAANRLGVISFNDAYKFYSDRQFGFYDEKIKISHKGNDNKPIIEHLAKAVEWFLLGAEGGNSDAQNNLAYLYSQGFGVEKDIEKAVLWNTMAAEQGHADSQHELAWYYKYTKKDKVKAAELCLKAAEQNHFHATWTLGYIYEKGDGLERDLIKAVYWYDKHAQLNTAIGFTSYQCANDLSDAKHGSDEKQVIAGIRYLNGWGVPLDKDNAKQWFIIAAEQGNKDGKKLLKEKFGMTDREIKAAGAKARIDLDRELFGYEED